MATLTGTKPYLTYKDLLRIPNGNAGFASTTMPVEDGAGQSGPIKLSTTKLEVTSGSELQVDGTLDCNGTVDIDATSGDISGVTLGQSSAISDLNVADMDASTGHITTLDGPMNCASQDMTNVDINSGTIDGTAVGGSVKAEGQFTDVTFTGAISGDGSGLTGLSGATGGISNAGGTTIEADNDNSTGGDIALQTSTVTRLLVENSSALSGRIQITADTLPTADATYDLGAPSYRWANIYAADLHLKNDKGDWTIQEGEEDLFLFNNKSGKKYKFKLEEIK